MLTLSFGLSKTSDAVQQQCQTVITFCGSNTYFTYTICGDSPEDILAKIQRAEAALCG